jgi:hypothetical protein
LTPAAKAVVAHATRRRRHEIAVILGRLSPRQRHNLTAALTPLVRAARKVAEDAWALGWAE